MATTTTYYGFDIPQSTDLVKDGATAIATLGQDIDTAMNTALGTKKSGLVLLNTTSFSAVSSQSLPTNTFTSTYQNYRILITLTAKSVTDDLRMRLRASGSDATGSNYARAGYVSNTAGTSGGAGESGVTNWGLGGINSAAPGRNILSLDLANVQLAQETTGNLVFGAQDGTAYRWGSFALLHDLTTAYDSLTIYPNSGTMSGRITTYGYNI